MAREFINDEYAEEVGELMTAEQEPDRTKSSLPENVPTEVVTLDKPRRIAFTMGALRRIQEQTGKSVLEFEKLEISQHLEMFDVLVWALLVPADRDGVEPSDVADWLHPGNMDEIIDAIERLSAASNDGDSGEEEPGKPPVSPEAEAAGA